MMATDKIQQIIGPRAPAEELTAHRMRYLWPALRVLLGQILQGR